MKCGFYYCLYNKNLCCILDSIEISTCGMCEECMIVTISDKDLELLKEEQLIAEGYIDSLEN